MYKQRLWKIATLWEQSTPSIQKRVPDFDVQKLTALYGEHEVSLVNSDFVLRDSFDFTPSSRPAYSDAYGSYYGLASSQLVLFADKPVYLFDNHNKIIQSFLEYHHVTQKAFDVVHIDAHADDALYRGERPHELALNKSARAIVQTRISDFFDYLSDTGIITSIHRYTKSQDFKNWYLPDKPFVLSLDIDIFGEEGAFCSLEEKIPLIKAAWDTADVVAIAMSPGFIDQDYAREIIKIFTQK